MATTIGMAEFLNKVDKLRKKEDKVSALKHNNSFELRTVLQGIYDPRVIWALPEGIPPFTTNTLPDQQGVFLQEIKKLIYFVEGSNHNLLPHKRESMFVELLEKIDPMDAQLLLSMKEKKMVYKSITKNVVREAFPGLLPEEEE